MARVALFDPLKKCLEAATAIVVETADPTVTLRFSKPTEARAMAFAFGLVKAARDSEATECKALAYDLLRHRARELGFDDVTDALQSLARVRSLEA